MSLTADAAIALLENNPSVRALDRTQAFNCWQ